MLRCIAVWCCVVVHVFVCVCIYIIFTTNELVDRIRKLKSNTSQNDVEEDFYLNTLAAGQNVMGTNELQAKPWLIRQNAPVARFFDWVWWLLCPIDTVCNLFYAKHSSESSSFNQWMNQSICSWLLLLFETVKLVPLLEGLCTSNPCRFEFSGFLSFCRNRTDNPGLRTDSPALWPTELILHRLGCDCQFINLGPAYSTSVFLSGNHLW